MSINQETHQQIQKYRKVLKIAGQSGMGIASVGEIVIKSLQKYGFNIYAEREFPSLIKGGVQNYQINFSKSYKVRSLHTQIDIALGLDREGLKDCLKNLKEGGVLIHGFDRWAKIIKDLPNIVEQKGIRMFVLPARELANENGGSNLMINTVLVGFLFQILGLKFEILEQQIKQTFSNKPALINTNIACAKAGYQFSPEEGLIESEKVDDKIENSQQMVIDGNSALALGALQAGVRAYFAYPMSPSTSILNYFAQTAEKTGMLVKQVEDEITVVQMTLGAMHAGTRALCATSGGGYDLMTETISLAGMIEVPLVVINVQRPGPATGLPTWTAQADLQLAIYSSHGEFSRLVVAISDPRDGYILIQKCFNLAEQFQIPVIILSEACIAMGFVSCDKFIGNQVLIERHLVENINELEKLKPEDRYNPNLPFGVSKRWIPGASKAYYYANGDEHQADGSLTEEGDKTAKMHQKRNAKTEALLANLPEPELYGIEIQNENSGFEKQISYILDQTFDLNQFETAEPQMDLLLIGWGSTKNPVLDAITILKENKPNLKVGYLHYSYLYPLKTEKLLDLIKKQANFYILEGNCQGQLANLIQSQTNLGPNIINPRKFLKYDGRPFYVDEIIDFILSVVN